MSSDTDAPTQEGPIEKALEVNSAPAVVEVNFETVKSRINQMLESYRGLTFTEDTLSEARRDATELNKLRQRLEERRKDVVRQVSEPIKVFDAQMKELSGLVQQTREEITGQIEAFNERKRAQVADLIPPAMQEWWDKLDVREEFRRAKTDNLVTQSNLTPGGKLTKGCVDKLKQLASNDARVQDRVDRRVMAVENTSRRAGLSSPLTFDNVRHIIEDPDEEKFNAEVDRLVNAELEREARMRREIEERERRRQEAEERARGEDAPDLQYPEGEETVQINPQPQEPERKATTPPKAEMLDEGDRYQWSVWAEFVVTVSPKAKQERIESELRAAIERANFKGLASVRADFVKVVKAEGENQ